MRLLAALGLLAALAVAAVAALASGERRALPEPPPAPRGAATPTPTPAPAPPRPVRASACDDGVPDCAAVRGRVLYVERVDPDGDGDLHVVVLDGSVTGPGITAVDVRPGLRPRRDPRAGDHVSAAGPVQTGSFGQSQIHALEFHARRG